MEPSSDAPPSQTTPTAQAVPTATPTNAEVPPLPPKNKGKVCGNRKKSIAQCCQYRTVPAGTAGIYRIGRQSSTVNPYVSYR